MLEKIRKGESSLVWELLIFVPWALLSISIWDFSRSTFVAPLNHEIFSIPFKILGDHRIVLPGIFLHPLLLVLSYLAPILLVVWFFILSQFKIGTKLQSSLIALVAVGIFYRLGAPSVFPSKLFEMILISIVSLPFVQRVSSWTLYIIASFACLVAAIDPSQSFFIFWAGLSLSLGHLLTRLLADKATPSRKEKKSPIPTFCIFTGSIFLSIWISFSTLHMPMDLITPSKFWWMSWLIGAFLVFTSWRRPWDVSRWLSICIFTQGLLFSKSLELPSYFLFAAILLLIIFDFLNAEEFQKQLPKALGKSLQYAVPAIVLVYMFVQSFRFPMERSFDTGWVGTLSELKEKKASPGFLIIGEGLPFMANFVSSDLLQSNEILAETSESALLKFLNEQQLNNIIIEKPYLNRYWRDWIKNGNDPETANKSVISRIVTYKGESLDTETLKIPALKGLEIENLKNSSHFVWVRKKSKDS